jgi:hypothetical protein
MHVANENGMPKQYLAIPLRTLDEVSEKFEIHCQQTALVVYGEELPEIAKVYIVCRKIEGLIDTTLEVYMRTLSIFLHTIHKPVEMITPNDICSCLFTYRKNVDVKIGC